MAWDPPYLWGTIMLSILEGGIATLALIRIPCPGATDQEYVIMLAVLLGILAIAFVVLRRLSNSAMGWASQHVSYRVPVVAMTGSLWLVWMLHLVGVILWLVMIFMSIVGPCHFDPCCW